MVFPEAYHLHLWSTSLNEAVYQERLITLLNAEEIRRAKRFKLALHRKRFIMARAALRSILSQYLNISPLEIQITYTEEGKPFLAGDALQFNLSHSQDLALYAFTKQIAVGVDIEKIRDSYQDDVAQRFFSPAEYAAFSQLSGQEKLIDFYRIWAGKEALVKALGRGIGFSLSSFTIPSGIGIKEVQLIQEGAPSIWYLENLDIFSGYQAAIASNQRLKQIHHFEWTP